MSEFGSPENVLKLLRGGPDMLQDGPEAGRRQADWERQIQTLDQKEMELHQTQLKLVRQQTATFVQDLTSLRQEVVAMKTRQDALHTDLCSTLDVKFKELRDQMERELKGRDAAHGLLQGKVAIFEKEFPSHRDELAAVRSQVRGVADLSPQLRDLKAAHDRIGEGLNKHSQLHQDMERKLAMHRSELDRKHDASHGALKDLLTQHADNLAKVQNGLQQDRSSRDFHTGTLNERLEKLEKDVMFQLSGRMNAWDADIKELKDVVGVEKRARESNHSLLQDSLKAHHATMAERMDYLEKVIGDSSDKHSRALEEARSKLHGSIKGQEAHHATVEDRLKYLERTIGDSADKHDKELEATHKKIDGLHGRIADNLSQRHATLEDRVKYVEKLMGDSADKHTQELRAAHAKIDQLHGQVRSLPGSDAHHATTRERIDYLEKLLGDSADRHARELEALKAAHAKHQDAFDKHAREVDGLRAAQAHHATVQERLNYVEKLLGDSADKHAEEMAALKGAHAKHELAFGKHAKEFEGLKAAHAHHATMAERLNYVEQLLGDSADRHSEELRAAHAKLDQVHGRMASFDALGNSIGDLKKAHASLASEKKALDTHHASLKERVDYLEKLAGDSADRHDKHGQAFDTASLKFEQLHGRLAACEKLGGALGDLKKSHASLANEKSTLDAHHATLKERVDYVERMLGDSADKHAKELQALRVAHNKHAIDLEAAKSASAHHATVGERLNYVERLLGDSADKHSDELAAAHAKIEQMHGRLSACEKHGASLGDLRKAHNGLANEKSALETQHATMKERVDYLEKLLGDSADKHSKELQALKAAHAKHAKDLEATKSAHAHHATMGERLNYVEKLLGDSADKHAEELAAAHAKLDQMHGRLSTCEKHGSSLGDLKKAHAGLASEKAALETHHATLKERVDYVEKLLGDSADRHAQELQALKAAHAKHAKDLEATKAAHAHHATFGERLEYMEKLLGDSVDKHADELAALRAAHAKHDAAVGKHAKELEGVKAAQGHHASMGERLDYVETLLGDSADKHAQELAAAHAKLEQMHGRVSACEKHGNSLGDLRKAHSSLASEKAALDLHHATLKERVDYLENMLGDSADRHAKMLEAAHAKMEQMHGRLAACERSGSSISDLKKAHEGLASDKKALDAHHATLQERMQYVEKLLGDSADKHAKELDALRSAHAKHEAAVGKHAKDMDGLKAAQGHHATVAERLGYLEKLVGDSADKHAKELAAAHAKVDKGLADERSAREAHHGSVREVLAKDKERERHHATLKERVDFLEGLIGDNADKHAQELEAQRAAHTKLATESKSRGAVHASMEERVNNLEKALGESFSRQAQEVKAAHAKVDRLNSRVSAVRGAWSSEV